MKRINILAFANPTFTIDLSAKEVAYRVQKSELKMSVDEHVQLHIWLQKVLEGRVPPLLVMNDRLFSAVNNDLLDDNKYVAALKSIRNSNELARDIDTGKTHMVREGDELFFGLVSSSLYVQSGLSYCKAIIREDKLKVENSPAFVPMEELPKLADYVESERGHDFYTKLFNRISPHH